MLSFTYCSVLQCYCRGPLSSRANSCQCCRIGCHVSNHLLLFKLQLGEKGGREGETMFTLPHYRQQTPSLTCLACSLILAAASGSSALDRLLAALRIFSFSLSCFRLWFSRSMDSSTVSWPRASDTTLYWLLSWEEEEGWGKLKCLEHVAHSWRFFVRWWK